MNKIDLATLEKEAAEQDLLLRVQVRRPLNLWAFRVLVGQLVNPNKVQALGEMKGWAYKSVNGLQLDTMQVSKQAAHGVGHLVWAATMAWALEETTCRRARLLAIDDDSVQHKKLRHYFQRRGFEIVKDVGSAPFDLPLRLVWGGAGSLMTADCYRVYESSVHLWKIACEKERSF